MNARHLMALYWIAKTNGGAQSYFFAGN